MSKYQPMQPWRRPPPCSHTCSVAARHDLNPLLALLKRDATMTRAYA